MPVHLFGRPAPLAELAALGLPLIEDAAQAFGAAGRREHGRLLHLQLLPDQEPLRARRRRPRRLPRRRGGRARADAPLPRLARQADLRARRHELAARRDPGRRAAGLPAAPRRAGTTAAARARRATPSSGSARPSTCRSTSRATSTTCTSSARPIARAISAALNEAGISSASYYVTPLHLQPAMRYLGYEAGSLPETERAAAENLALPLWGTIGADVAGAGRRGRARRTRARARTGTGDSVLAPLP